MSFTDFYFFRVIRRLTPLLALFALLATALQPALGQTAYVANFNGGNVAVVDLETGTVTGTISFPPVGNNPAAPIGISASPDGSQLIVAAGNRVFAIDPTSSNFTELTSNFGFVEVRSAVYSQDGNNFFTIDASSTIITPFNSQTLSESGGIGFSSNTTNTVSGALDPATNNLAVVGNGGNNVVVFTTNPLTESGGPIAVGQGPQDIAFLPGSSVGYVSNFNSNSVSVINADTRSLITTISGVSSPAGIAASPDGSVVYVTNNNANTVTVIDPTSNSVVTTIDVGTTPRDVAFSDDGSVAAVANSGDGTVSIIDVTTNSVTGTVPGVGASPNSIAVIGEGASQNMPPMAVLAANPTQGEAPLTVSFDATGSTDDNGIVSYAFDFGDGSPSETNSTGTISHTYNTAGTFTATVIVTDAEGLSDDATITITVEEANQAPMAILAANPTQGEAPLMVAFDATSSTDDNGVVSYTFNFGDGSPTETNSTGTTIYTYTNPGTFTATVTVEDAEGLTDEATIIITVETANQAPTAALVANPTEGDAPLTVAFDATGSTDDNGVVSYAFDFGDGSPVETNTTGTITHTYDNAGTFTATVIATDAEGLSDDATATITVTQPNQAPMAALIASPTGGEAPLMVDFDATGSTDDAGIATYSFDFGDGSPIVENTTGLASHTYDNDGMFTATVTVTDAEGLSDDATVMITVAAGNAAPMAALTASPTEGEAPLMVMFDATSSMDDNGIANFSFDFGDGSPAVENTTGTATYTYESAGTFTATVTVTDDQGLSDTATETITVEAPNMAPMAMLTADPSQGEPPLEVSFDATGSTDDAGIATYAFDFGDGSPVVENTTGTATNTYESAGTFTATVTVTDAEGLSDMATVTITVAEGNQAPMAVLEASPEMGDAPLMVMFDATGSTDDDAIVNYIFDFGDGSMVVENTSGMAGKMYMDAGTFTASVVVEDAEGLTDTATVTITVTEDVNQAPMADLTATPESGDAPLAVMFDATGSTDDNGIESFSFDFGDGSPIEENTSGTAMNTYESAGTFTASVTVTDAEGLTATAMVTITVTEEDTVDIGAEVQAVVDTQTVTLVDIGGGVELSFGGLAAAVRRGDDLFTATTGFAAPNIPVTTMDLFGASDYTQTYMAALTLALVEEGSISLDQTVGDFTSTAGLTNIPGDRTIQQLLSHTSGLDEFSEDDDYTSTLLFDPFRNFTAEDLTELFVGEASEPGTFSYSNTNFLVLGVILDEANGAESLQESLDRLFFTPLELETTQVYPGSDPQNSVLIFDDLFGTGLPSAITPATSIYTGAGSAGNILGLPVEFLDFLAAVLEGDVLNESSLDLLLNFISADGRLSDEYGLGIEKYTLQIDGQPLDFIGHVGDINTVAAVLYNSEFDAGVSVVTNNSLSMEEDILNLAQSLLDVAIDNTPDTMANMAPMAVFTADPTSGVAPLEVSFDASASMDPDGEIVSFEFDFGNDSTSTDAVTTTTYESAGMFTVTLVVTDNEGATDTATQVITVTEEAANMAPVAELMAMPTSGTAPLTVNFDAANSSDADGNIVSFEFVFGDGGSQTDTLETAMNTYTTPGTFEAFVVVTDNEGATDTARVTVTVFDEASDTASIRQFQLTDRDGNVLIENIMDGAVINLGEVGNIPLNIEALTNPDMVGSVVFSLTGPVDFNQIESFPPYFLFGNPAPTSDAQINYAQLLPEGNYTLTATPFTDRNGQGEAGNSTTISFTVVLDAVIDRFTLVDADRNVLDANLENGDVINLARLDASGFNIQAITSPMNIGSVTFDLDGPGFTSANRTENFAPYEVYGNGSRALEVGTYTLTAQPFEDRGAQGTAGPAEVITFEVVNCEAVASTLVADEDDDNCLSDGSANLSATVDVAGNVPAGFDQVYVLTSGENLVVEDVSSVPAFTVSDTGRFTIHCFVFDPTFLSLQSIDLGTTTGAEVVALLVQGNGSVCGDLDVVGAPFDVEACDPALFSTLQLDALNAKQSAEVFELGVYPNPANSQVMLQLNGTIEGVSQVEILDISGKVMRSIQVAKVGTAFNIPVDVSGLPSGMYQIRAKLNDRIAIARLVIAE